MNGLLLFNAKAGNGDTERLELLKKELRPAVVWKLAPDDDIAELVWRAKSTPGRYVAVAGGDGTVGAAANTLVGTKISLGIIPCGTYNNFAKSLNIPQDIAGACSVIRAGHGRAVSAGSVNGKLFFESAGIGLDAELFPTGEKIKSGKPEHWLDFFSKAYRFPNRRLTLKFPSSICAIAVKPDHLTRSHYMRHLLKSEASEVTLRCLLVIVSNSPLYGANFAIAPDQEPDSGQFTVSVFHPRNKFRLLLHFIAISIGLKMRVAEMIVLRTPRVSITSNELIPVHVDGTSIEETLVDKAVEIECLPKALHVFAPDSN